mgnify:CR=1 FL=1
MPYGDYAGISRGNQHKRRATGGKRSPLHKKRKHELGRPAAMTKLGPKRVHTVRGRGGNLKFRAMRLESGNFSWGTEVCARKARILDVVYNASNNELVRTKTLVKGAIVLVDAHPFKDWYQAHYGVEIGQKKIAKKGANAAFAEEMAAKSAAIKAKFAKRQSGHTLFQNLDDQFSNGRLLASISSRPGQTGRVDGYILEGKELEFYQKQLARKKKGHKA